MANEVDTAIVRDRLAESQPLPAGHFCRLEEICLPLLVRVSRFGLKTRLGTRR